MSIITLITGIIAAINQVLRLNDQDEDDEDLETLAGEIDEVEARLDEYEARLTALQEKKQ